LEVVDADQIMSIVTQMHALAVALRRDMNKMKPFTDTIISSINDYGLVKITRLDWMKIGCGCPGLLKLLEAGDWWPNPMTGPLAKELVRRTNYGKTELRRLRSAFDEFDTDKSGDLNKIEFRKIICGLRLFPGASEEILDTLFTSFDNDNSQSIAFNELASALAVLSKATPEEKLLYMFEIYDADGSGDLDVGEVQAIVRQMKIVTDALGRDTAKLEPFVRILVDEGDKDGNGTISKMEWMQSAKKGNGVLDLLQFNYSLAAPSPEHSPETSPRTVKEKKKEMKDKEKKSERTGKIERKRKKRGTKEDKTENKRSRKRSKAVRGKTRGN